MTRLILTRHGQTVWNSELRYQGQLDTPLSDLGKQQSLALARALQPYRIDRLLSSDLARCYDTATLVGELIGLRAEMTPELREANYGQWQSLTYAEVRAKFPEAVRRRHDNVVDFCPPGGESLGATFARAKRYLSSYCNRDVDETVLVVTHGGPLRFILAHLLGMPLRNAFKLRFDNCGISIVENFPDMPEVVTVNDTTHLTDLVAADPALGN